MNYSDIIKSKKFAPVKNIIEVILIVALFTLLSYLLSVVLFDFLFPNISKIYLPFSFQFSKIFLSFFILVWFIECIDCILILIMTLIVYKRTSYINYIYEGLNYIFFAIGSFFILPFMVFNSYSSLFFSFVLIVQWLPGIQYFLAKKPLIWVAPYHRKTFIPLSGSKSDIILRQSLFINQFEDGFTTRPLFISFSDLFGDNISPENLEYKSVMFAKFLALNGDLIGYQHKGRKLYCYLRTALIRKRDILNPITLFNKVKRIVGIESITTVIFDFDSKELSFKLSKFDYLGLDNLTYHELAIRILNQFKVGYEKFIEEKYVEAYREIVPSNIKTRSLIFDYSELTFIIITYLTGLVTIGLTYFYYATVLTNLDLLDIVFLAIIWPMVTFSGIEIFSGILMGDPTNLRYLTYVPVLFFVHFIAIFLSFEVYKYLRRFEMKRKDNPLRGIKIPIELKTGRETL